MISYTKNELVGITELSKSLSAFIDKVASNAIQKLAVIKHNKPEVVILSIAEYERITEFHNYFEDLEIAKVIQERVLDKKEPVKMMSQEEMFNFLKERGCNV